MCSIGEWMDRIGTGKLAATADGVGCKEREREMGTGNRDGITLGTEMGAEMG